MDDSSNSQIFPLAPKRRALLIGFAALFILCPLALAIAGTATDDTNLASAGYITTLILVPFGGFFIFMSRFPRLTLSTDGISARGTVGFSTYSAPWSNVERLRVMPGSEAVILRTPLEGKAANTLRSFAGVRFNGTQYYDDEQQQLISECRYLPIEAFGWWLDQGELLGALKRFAPQLVARFEQDRAAAEGVRRTARRVIWWVLGISALILAGTFYFAMNEDKISPATQEAIKHGTDVVYAWFSFLAAFAFIMYGVINCRAAYRHLKLREYWLALLWLFAGVTQLLLSLLLFSIWSQGVFPPKA